MADTVQLSRAMPEPPADLYITGQLDLRPPKHADHLAEKQALQELATEMLGAPQAVLPRFVALAQELTGASTAGISRLEPGEGGGLFRWQHLQGRLARFEGVTTPRNHSPCGVTLDCRGPVLVRHPERFYEWIAAEGLVIPEALLVPLHVGSDEPLGTLWAVSDEEGHFRKNDARLATELASFVGIALRMLDIESGLRSALGEQELVAREMGHRLKNMFAMTESMIRMTARNAGSADAMATTLSGRLHALSEAHSLVRRQVAGIGEGPMADLERLIRAVVTAHDDGRFEIAGPPIDCGDHAINGIALVIHELATNAAKYGALSRSSGRISVTWMRDGDALVVTWRERGGPRIEGPPASTGFGTTLAQRTLSSQFAGAIEHRWEPEGLVARMSLALARLGS